MNKSPHTNNSGLQPAEMLCATVAHFDKFKILSFVSSHLCKNGSKDPHYIPLRLYQSTIDNRQSTIRIILCAFVPFLFLTFFLPISAFSLSKDAIKFYEIGNKNFRSAMYEEAIKNYQKAIKIESKYFWPNFNLGRAYMQADEYHLAIEAFEKAKAINPDHEGIDIFLQDCYARMQTMPKTEEKAQMESVNEFKKPDAEYSGVIIDAKELGVQASMCPKIEDETGKEIYTGGEAPVDYVISVGIVGYSKNVESAKKMRRVSPKPLIIKAIKGKGIVKTEVVISSTDGEKLIEANKLSKFFEKCAVVFVID